MLFFLPKSQIIDTHFTTVLLKSNNIQNKSCEIDKYCCNLVKTLQVNTRAVCCMRAASAAKHALYQLKFEDDWNDDQ